MNWIDTNTLIAICTCAIGLTQFLFWRYIAKQKSYESEKGKNFATKEDIGEITKEIKSVESVFVNETEKIKANLSLLAGIQINLSSEERNAIIDFNKCLYRWDTSTSDSSVDISNNDKLVKHIEKMEDLYYKTVNSQTLFNLFIDDKALKNNAYDLMIEIIKVQTIRNKYVYELTEINDEFHEVKEKQYFTTKERREALEKVLKKRKEVFSKSLNDVSQAQSKNIELKHDFEQKCRERIYNLCESVVEITF